MFSSQKVPDASFFRLEDCSIFTRISAGHVARQHDGKLQCVGHKIRGAEKKVKIWMDMDGLIMLHHVFMRKIMKYHE